MRGPRRSRDDADLQFTMADCDWFADHLRAPDYENGVTERHFRLVNPTCDQLVGAIDEAGRFLSGFVSEQAWSGGQMTFVYAGHGEPRTGAWVLAHGSLSGIELAEFVGASLKPSGRRCRVDMLLDSCFAGAFFADFLSHSWGPLENRVFPCEILGACLEDELAWELEEYGHGAFTFAFRAMFEPLMIGEPRLPRHRRTGIRDTDRLRSGGVSWLTDDDQHAFEYVNGHLSVIGAGYAELHGVNSVSSAQVRAAMADALAVMPRERVQLRP